MIVLPQLMMLFAIAAVGALLRKKGVLTDPVVRGFSDTVTLVTNPLLLIMVTQHEYNADTLGSFFHVLWMSTLIMALITVVVYAACRGQSEKTRPILALLTALPNSGFMGLPIIQAVYGDLGALYLAAFVVAFNLVLWTVGIAVIDRHKFSLRRMLNPGFVAAIIGTALFLLRIDFPPLLDAPINTLGSINTPLAMLVLGARLTGVKPRALIDVRNALVAGIKLIAMPVLALLLARAISLNPVAAGSLVLASAMPSAIMCQMLAEQYDRDAVFAAREVSITSLLSILTIPLIVAMLGV